MLSLLAYLLPIILGLLEVFRNYYGNKKLIFKKKAIYFSIIFLLVGGAIIAQYFEDESKRIQINELNSHLSTVGYKYDLALKKLDSISLNQGIKTGDNKVLKFFDVSGDNNSISASNLNYYNTRP